MLNNSISALPGSDSVVEWEMYQYNGANGEKKFEIRRIISNYNKDYEKKRIFCALILGVMIAACNTSTKKEGAYGIQNDIEKMGYRGAVKGIKIEEFIPDTRAGQGLALGKTATLSFDNDGRLLSSITSFRHKNISIQIVV